MSHFSLLNLAKQVLLYFPIVLIALTFHEYAHGFVSTKLGDPTPIRQGRLTLNPLAHLDPFGAILMILTGFGWAKPVQVDPSYYKNRKVGMAVVAAAGPIMNLLLSFASVMVFAIWQLICNKTGASQTVLRYFGIFVENFAYVNICFAIFNIIPIPPLDGSRVIGLILPDRAYDWMMRNERYIMIVLMLLAVSGVFNKFIGVCSSGLLTQMLRFFDWLINLI